ncbi:hypothetical protein BpHYR1_002290 [Brachionus plicatilis]|uniref:Uncharacterized protein n=1 Tax=Brachionus plicatilis TaxID=10195 RepID=A0A3M7PUT8_BRAPC|nr:hypothetical protein BpHYR1_002290 [Brachionus plicatilis]
MIFEIRTSELIKLSTGYCYIDTFIFFSALKIEYWENSKIKSKTFQLESCDKADKGLDIRIFVLFFSRTLIDIHKPQNFNCFLDSKKKTDRNNIEIMNNRIDFKLTINLTELRQQELAKKWKN